jgi:thiosulfate/3-mercaptopyruvate sulfurtransferase
VYEPLGPFIAHCGSGLTACETVFAARLAGLPQPRLYEGSWSDWVHDRSRPVASGDA